MVASVLPAVADKKEVAFSVEAVDDWVSLWVEREGEE